jgi:TolB-like protein
VRIGRLKSLIATLSLVALVQCAGQVTVTPVIDPDAYPRLAVLPFKTESIFSTIGYQIADEIVVELVEKAPDFHIVERARVDALLLEQDLGNQGASDGEPILRAARLLGVDALLTGSVSLSLEDVLNAPEREERRAEGVAVVRLIDAKDGRIIWAKRVESDYGMLTSLYGDIYVSQTDHDLVQRVVRDMAHLVAAYFYPHSERER